MNERDQTENTGAGEASFQEEKEPSFFGIIVHSFFVIPFLIAVFCLLLFTAVSLLTREQQTVYDYINEVKTGGITKRWQAAFELSKILSSNDPALREERFVDELTRVFKDSVHDDNRVRQYLALAMGRTGKTEFFVPLTENIEQEKEDNLYAVLYALGMLKDKRAVPILERYLDHPNAMLRSAAVVSLGNIGDISAKELLKKSLSDSEPNVQWGASLSLAALGDNSGKEILSRLLNRNYFSQFPEVDPQEQTHLVLAAIQAVADLKEKSLFPVVEELAKTDSNMKVRSAAMEAVEELKK